MPIEAMPWGQESATAVAVYCTGEVTVAPLAGLLTAGVPDASTVISLVV
jgi:hypothetical protein